MSFRNSQQARLYVHNLALASYARNAAANSQTDMLDTTVLTDTSRKFIPGQDSSTFTADGPIDQTQIASLNASKALLNSLGADGAVAVTYLPVGSDGHAWLMEGFHTRLDTTTATTSTADWSFATQTTGRTDFNGVILEDNTTVTTDTDGTAVDNAAATSNGAAFHLHVTAYTGLTSDVITVEGSATGAFAGEETTVATFTTMNSVQYALAPSERVEVTGTVPRYLRVADDVTGTGSISRFVAVSRR